MCNDDGRDVFFFFKQKTAYEILSGLVGSEMCIRDKHKTLLTNRPKHIVRAEGCFMINEAGDRILDATAGLWCVNVGHGRKELAEVAKTQMENLLT